MASPDRRDARHPLDVECPFCEAKPGDPCIRVRTGKPGYEHDMRIIAAYVASQVAKTGGKQDA